MKSVLLILFLFIDIIYSRYLLEENHVTNNTGYDNVEEIQHAVCKIATEEVQASANASITRQLNGVCSSKAMNARLNELQRILLTELETFKLMLVSVGYTTPRPANSLAPRTKSSNTYGDYQYTSDIDNKSSLNGVKSLEYNNKIPSTNNHDSMVHRKQLKTKGEIYPREHEVKEMNETIIKTDMGKAFVFFWRIIDMENILKEDIELSSPLIEYLGNSLFIKLSTRYLGGNYVSLELLTPNKFTNPFRFVFMHKKIRSDFNSPLLGNTKPPTTLFRITRGKIQSLLFSGALLIKLLVYLNL